MWKSDGSARGENRSDRSGGEGDDGTEASESGARVGGLDAESATVLRLWWQGQQTGDGAQVRW